MDLATANDVLSVLVKTGRARPAAELVPWLRAKDEAEKTAAKINNLF